MLKQATLGLASVALLLSGCGGPKDEYAKGVSLYEKGDYKNLVKAKEFFNDYTAKNPSDGSVDKWVAKVDNALVAKAKEMANEAYEKKDLKEALKYAEVAKAGAPNDKEINKAYNLVKKAYNEQVKFDKFARYLEESYIETKSIAEEWDNAVKLAETGKAQPISLLVTARNIYPKVIALREKINAQSFTLTGGSETAFQEANSTLFSYVVNIENNFSQIMSLESDTSTSSYVSQVDSLSPDTLNRSFLDVQDEIDSYVNEKNEKGEAKRYIKNTLQLTKAYDKKKAAEKEASEETPQPTNQSTTTTKTAPVTKTVGDWTVTTH
ncbi:hypothetical protein [Priestia megaterium]|uniref:Lipoprotein n=1 Tax=Priestia megaterium TaxID=1404 RepID=A0A6M6DZ66_PRIMG|nr:hypothetical protein [Priestia megaterium]QJX80191.1 hypothetical protein FDZ14_29275 [Priestia megaterium]